MKKIHRNYILKDLIKMNQLKSCWQEALQYSAMAYNPLTLKKKFNDGLIYLYLDDRFPEREESRNKKGKYFNFNKVNNNQLLFTNIFGNNKYNVLINKYPREKYDFLIVSKKRRPQKLILLDKKLIESLIYKNVKIWFNYHYEVVNHWHLHLVIKKPDYYNYINKKLFNLKYSIIQNNNFDIFFKDILNFQNQNKNKSFSQNLILDGKIFKSYIIFKYKKDMIGEKDIHNSGIICIRNKYLFDSIDSIIKTNNWTKGRKK